MPESEKRVERLGPEADAVMAAGTVTTAESLAVMSFHILNELEILAKLKNEVESVSHGNTSNSRWQDLEPLPYMTAVIKEGLRVCPGVTARLPRLHPDNVLQFQKWTIPPGTPVSMSILTVHQDPAIFPSPETFNPDRWLGPGADKLERYLIAFSKGTRQCVGIELAEVELYLTLAKVFGAEDVKMELLETTARDVEIVGDIFNPDFAREPKGVRVVIK